ncbi:MAG: hypothetical protein ABS873_01900, partial [Alkalibacterium sp.]
MNSSADSGIDYYINPKKVFQSRKKREIFKEMLDEVTADSGITFDKEEVLNETNKRETLSTTGFG